MGLNYIVNYSPNVVFDPANFGSVFSIAGTSDVTNVAGGATFYEGVPDGDLNLSVAGTVTYVVAKNHNVTQLPNHRSATLPLCP